MPLNSHYRFFIGFPFGEVQVWPQNDSITFKDVKSRDWHHYTREVEDELIFKGDDWARLYALESNGSICENLPLVIERREGGNWVDCWRGIIALIDGKYDVDNCVLRIKPRRADGYACIKAAKKNRILVQDLEGHELNWFAGEIETRRRFFAVEDHTADFVVNISEADSQWPDGEAWRISYIDRIYDTDFQTGTFEGWEVTWRREVVESLEKPPGEGWVQVGGSWYRPAGSLPDRFYDSTLKKLDNAKRLPEVLALLYDQCGLTIVSDFLGINPDETAPDNEYYANSSYYRNLYVIQKSDVKRPEDDDAEGNLESGVGTLSIDEMHQLYHFMNLSWEINDGIIRIEHRSYYQPVGQLDLTKPALEPLMKGTHMFEYDVEKRPREEMWQWAEESTPNFDGGPITYDYECSNPDLLTEKKEFKASKFMSNVTNILFQPDKYSDDGYVIVTAEEWEGSTYVTAVEVGGAVLYNGALALPYLQRNYLKYGRPHSFGFIGGQEVAFESRYRTKEQAGIIAHLCREEYFGNYRARDLIKTQIGWGAISEAQYTEPDQSIKLKILH